MWSGFFVVLPDILNTFINIWKLFLFYDSSVCLELSFTEEALANAFVLVNMCVVYQPLPAVLLLRCDHGLFSRQRELIEKNDLISQSHSWTLKVPAELARMCLNFCFWVNVTEVPTCDAHKVTFRPFGLDGVETWSRKSAPSPRRDPECVGSASTPGGADYRIQIGITPLCETAER